MVVRLLIRRPECFGPALRGEGGNGLLAAMEEAIKISEDSTRDGPSPVAEASRTLYVQATDLSSDCLCVLAVSLVLLAPASLSPVHVLPCRSDALEDEEDDTIHMGNAIMTFYSALIDLLGRCAPEMHVRAQLILQPTVLYFGMLSILNVSQQSLQIK